MWTPLHHSSNSPYECRKIQPRAQITQNKVIAKRWKTASKQAGQTGWVSMGFVVFFLFVVLWSCAVFPSRLVWHFKRSPNCGSLYGIIFYQWRFRTESNWKQFTFCDHFLANIVLIILNCVKRTLYSFFILLIVFFYFCR